MILVFWMLSFKPTFSLSHFHQEVFLFLLLFAIRCFLSPAYLRLLTNFNRPLLSSIQSLSHVRLFVTPWTTAHQASLSITNSWSLPKPMSIESVMPSNHLILCSPILLLPSIFPVSGSFQMSQFFTSGGQSIGVSALTSVLPMNTQDWSPLSFQNK